MARGFRSGIPWFTGRENIGSIDGTRSGVAVYGGHTFAVGEEMHGI
jgi:hypothetical protein